MVLEFSVAAVCIFILVFWLMVHMYSLDIQSMHAGSLV